jgi:hypothetical protein
LVDIFEVLIIIELVCALDAKVVSAPKASESTYSTVLMNGYFILSWIHNSFKKKHI